MNLEKSQFKALVIESIGAEFDDDLESLQAKVQQYRGAADALYQASKIISDLSGKVRDELMDGKVKFDPDDPLAAAKFTVSRMQDVVARLRELGDMAKVSMHKADGERDAMSTVIKKMKKMYDVEIGKVRAIEQARAEASERGVEAEEFSGRGPRLVGTHPGLPMKLRRQLELEAEAAASPPEVAPSSQPAEAEAVEPKPKKTTKRARKAKVTEVPHDANA